MWNPIETAPDGVPVMTKISDGHGDRNEQIMTREGRMWFAGSTYVYYEPTHWRELTPVEKLKVKNEAERKAIQQLEAATKGLGL